MRRVDDSFDGEVEWGGVEVDGGEIVKLSD